MGEDESLRGGGGGGDPDVVFVKTVRVQSLLQWTAKEHPDYSLLLGAERALRDVLCRCHVILEEDVRWEEGEGSGRRSENDGKQEIRSMFVYFHTSVLD